MPPSILGYQLILSLVIKIINFLKHALSLNALKINKLTIVKIFMYELFELCLSEITWELYAEIFVIFIFI